MSKVITADDLSGYMGKDLNAVQSKTVVDAVNTYIETHTHRVWGETRDITETYDLAKVIWLRHQDVTNVTSLKLGYSPDQTTLSSSNYRYNSLGRLVLPQLGTSYFRVSPHARLDGYVEVAYTYGNAKVSDDLKEAALGIAAGLYNYATSNQQDIVASQVGSYRLQFKLKGTGNERDAANNTTDLHWAVIDSYKMQRV